MSTLCANNYQFKRSKVTKVRVRATRLAQCTVSGLGLLGLHSAHCSILMHSELANRIWWWRFSLFACYVSWFWLMNPMNLPTWLQAGCGLGGRLHSCQHWADRHLYLPYITVQWWATRNNAMKTQRTETAQLKLTGSRTEQAKNQEALNSMEVSK